MCTNKGNKEKMELKINSECFFLFGLKVWFRMEKNCMCVWIFFSFVELYQRT